MPNERIINLITEQLPNLTHPGDGNGSVALPVSAFRATNTLPPEVAAQFAQDAGLPSSDVPRLVAEAIVHLIEVEADSEIVPRAELRRLQTTSTADLDPEVQVLCNCGIRLFSAHLRDNDGKLKVAGPQLIKAMRTLGTECALAHRQP